MKLETNKTLTLYSEIVSELRRLIAGSEYENHVYTVGGCERDRKLGLPIKDIDLVVDLPNGGIQFALWLYKNKMLVREPVIYENYGTAMFCLKSYPDFELEAVQTRKESYRDMTTRNPETAYGTIEEDCKRRDFTINSLYRNISTEKLEDFTGKGLEDLDKHLIRSCDDPNIIFNEDPLRVMRAVRFATKLGWIIEENTLKGLYNNAERLEIVSRERITDEFNKILSYDSPMGAISTLKAIGALKFVSEELNDLSSKDLNDSINSLRLTKPELVERLAVLFIKAKNQEKALRTMKYPNALINDVMTVIREIPVIQSLGGPTKTIDRIAVRKQQFRVKTPSLHFHVAVAANAILNGNNMYSYSITDTSVVNVLSVSIDEHENKTSCFEINLPINGQDVMDYKNIAPGPQVKTYLDAIQEAYFENPKITRHECFEILDKTTL